MPRPPARPAAPRPPVPARPSVPLPRRDVPLRDYAAEQESARLLTQANIALRRGQAAEARKAVDAVLALHPNDAAAHEMLADICLAQNNWDGATAALKTALIHEPTRATAEAKLGRAALRRMEQERIKTMGVAYAASHASLVRFDGGGERARRGWLPPLASAFLPGLGQIIEGASVKGGVLMALYFLGLLGLSQIPGTRALIQGIVSPFAAHAAHGAASELGGGSVLLLALLFALWLYAVIDAGRAAQGRSADPEKSGWEV